MLNHNPHIPKYKPPLLNVNSCW